MKFNDVLYCTELPKETKSCWVPLEEIDVNWAGEDMLILLYAGNDEKFVLDVCTEMELQRGYSDLMYSQRLEFIEGLVSAGLDGIQFPKFREIHNISRFSEEYLDNNAGEVNLRKIFLPDTDYLQSKLRRVSYNDI
jgi:hypothetical protein